MIEQLTALAGEPPAGLLTGSGRHGQLLALLKTAAQRSQQSHRRLLLVVDGLDEDTSARAGRASIASLLPRRPPPEVRVLVASRPHPPVPDDVPADHPLRNVPPRPLARSSYAHSLELRAKHELQELLTGSPLQQAVLGYITASGGGLTLPDLEHLTGRPPFELDSLLGGVFGRSVQSRGGTPGIHRSGERVYLFAHETLRIIAEEQFGGTLAEYRDGIHRWADGYRERGWPPDDARLPDAWLLTVAGTNDLARLADCATDTARHDWMLHHTGGDHLALTEIAAAQDLNLREADVDLEIALRLAFERDHVAQRNTNIPADMPTVWSRLGETARAEALARTITDPDRQARALSALAQAAAAAGEHDRAEGLARTITDPYRQAEALSALAQAAAAAGEHDRAEDLARTITDPDRQARALSALAQAAAAAGEHDRAEGLARTITDPYRQGRALSALAQAAAAAGEQDRAGRLLSEAEAWPAPSPTPDREAGALSALAQAAAAAGELDRAGRLLSQVEQLTRTITDPARGARALSALARRRRGRRVGRAGRLLSQAEDLARTITDPYRQAEALSALAQAAAVAGARARPARRAWPAPSPTRTGRRGR